MTIEQLNPFIRYANMHETFYAQKEQSVCYDCRLFFILQGDGKFLVNGQSYSFSQGFCTFLPPKTRYSFSFNDYKNAQIYVLNFDLTDAFYNVSKSLGTATESSFSSEKVLNYPLPHEFQNPIMQSNGMHIQPMIADCTELYLKKIAYYKHSASAYLKLALLELLRGLDNEKSDYRLVQSVQEYIRKNYHLSELNNQEIAKHFNYHPYHINRLMKTHTNKTLHDCLIEYRLHRAKIFLRTTALNVTAISEKTGFASYTYFIKLFRERVGVSPLQYRKSHKNIGI